MVQSFRDEVEAFVGHEMRGAAGTRHGGVTLASRWLGDGKAKAQGRGMGSR